MSNHKLKLTLALTAALLSGHSAAQDADNDDEKHHSSTSHASADLPDGFTVLEHHVKAIGGVEANTEIKGVQMIGRFDMPAMGLGGSIDIKMHEPNMRVMDIMVDGMGAIKQGTDGKVAWTTQMPGTPPTMLKDEQAQAQIDEADFYGRVKPREQYTSAETVGEFTFDDKKVYKVKLVDKAGNHSEGLYEIESGLLRKQSFKETPEATDFATETEFNDYREIKDGIKMPFELVVSSAAFEQVITFTEIKVDPEFPEGTFDAPGAL